MVLNERSEMVREILKVMRIHGYSDMGALYSLPCFHTFPDKQVFKVIDATEEISAVRELLET